jgi:RNA polymerase I-specific transcription initiation factor RRN3
MYVFPLLAHLAGEQQQHAQLPPAVAVSTNPSTLRELMSFFPFDPYKLPRSSSYIDPIYREWASVAVGVEDDDDDDDDEAEEEEEEVDLDVRVQADSDGLGASFEEMRISPVPAPPHRAAVALGISSIVG